MILEKRDSDGWHILDDTSIAAFVFWTTDIHVRASPQEKATQQLTLKPTNAHIHGSIGRWGCLESWGNMAKIVWEGGEDGA